MPRSLFPLLVLLSGLVLGALPSGLSWCGRTLQPMSAASCSASTAGTSCCAPQPGPQDECCFELDDDRALEMAPLPLPIEGAVSTGIRLDVVVSFATPPRSLYLLPRGPPDPAPSPHLRAQRAIQLLI